MIREVWTEFKSSVMPWVLAALVVALAVQLTRGEADTLREQLAAERQQTLELSTQVGRLTDLLAQQGYVLPPLRPLAQAE